MITSNQHLKWCWTLLNRETFSSTLWLVKLPLFCVVESLFCLLQHPKHGILDPQSDLLGRFWVPEITYFFAGQNHLFIVHFPGFFGRSNHVSAAKPIVGSWFVAAKLPLLFMDKSPPSEPSDLFGHGIQGALQQLFHGGAGLPATGWESMNYYKYLYELRTIFVT